MLASFDLPSAIQACEEAIRLNDAASVDRLGRIILNGKSIILRWHASEAKRELSRGEHGIKHLYGPTWRGPALADVIASCEYHRINSAVRKVRVA